MEVRSVAPGLYLCAQLYVGHKRHSILNILDDLQIRPFCLEKATWPLTLELKKGKQHS